MSEVGDTIKSLLFDDRQAGADMTHRLKVLGNGSMQDGMKRLATFFIKEGRMAGFKEGEKSGIVKGSLGTLAIGSAIAGTWYLVEQHKQKKKHEEDGGKILNTLRQEESEKRLEEYKKSMETEIA